MIFSKSPRVSRVLIFLFLAVVAFIFLVPFLWSVITSLKPDNEIYSPNLILWPSRFTLDHYVTVFTRMQDFLSFSTNTVFITFWSVLFTLLFSSMMGYGFSKLDFFGKKIIFAFILLVLILPYAIYLIPIYIMESKANLVNTTWGLILPYIAINLPLSVLIMQGTFNNIPNELAEAAKMDGCNFYQVWRSIMLPIASPGLATVVIFTFINVWGEFMYARTLTSSPAAQTLSVGITFLRDEAASWQYGTLTATIVISLVPLVIVFLAMQRYFIKGITEGALKG